MEILIQILNFKIIRNQIISENIPELFELFNIHTLPLATSKVEFEIKGVSTSIINGIRRVITDEMIGHYLQLSEDSISPLTTDKFADHQFINSRLSTIPLRYLISPTIVKKLRLSIDITNTSSEQLFIHSGDLIIEEDISSSSNKQKMDLNYPIFNPTFILFSVQPGKRVVINNIYITSGLGKDFAGANIACNARYKHLDIEEYTKEETHSDEGLMKNFSGYKISSLVATPKHHLFSAIIPATGIDESEINNILIAVCDNIISRLRLISTSIEKINSINGNINTTNSIQFTILDTTMGLEKGILIIPNETYTIGTMLSRAIYDIIPDIAIVTSLVYENKVELVIQHTENVTGILRDAIQYCITIFNTIKKKINSI